MGVVVFPERRGGRVKILCDGEVGKSGVRESIEDDRNGSMNCGGIGGGANSDVKMPRPTECCGDVLCIVDGAGLSLISIVSVTEVE